MPQGTLEWRMHESQHISSILWKDKKPIGFPCMPIDTIPKWNGTV
jgi:hypothetical protein